MDAHLIVLMENVITAARVLDYAIGAYGVNSPYFGEAHENLGVRLDALSECVRDNGALAFDAEAAANEVFRKAGAS
jgi:hypothetical protein